MAALLDGIAARCLPRQAAGRSMDQGEIVILRRLTLGFFPAVVLLPALLSSVFGLAAGLPLGVGLASALFMLACVALVAGRRLTGPEKPAGEPDMPNPFHGYEACPGLFLTLDHTGMVRAAGGRDREIYLAFLREPLLRPFVEHVHVSDRLAFAQSLDALRQGADAVVIDLRLDRPVLGLTQTQFLNVRMDMTAIRRDDGALQAVQAQILDIESELKMRDAMRQKEHEAIDAHETKSRFLAAVSHELRTPLNAILGFSDILAGEYFGKLETDRQREYVQLIRQSGAHLLSVVNTMLDMSKIEAGRYELQLERFEVDGAVIACERMLSLQAAEKGVKLTSRLSRGLGDIVADERALRQILINLVGNAIKFTEEGGVVTIDATRQGANVVLSVSDTGIGIPADKIAMLGRPFTQIQNDLNRNYEGSGLGLSLVKGLTALHGGTFSIASRPGEGTVATIVLPLDGSGAVQLSGEDETMVEFPPRLAKTDMMGAQSGKTDGNDEAKAKIA
ncbi:sensor histidine kinase [Rhizobium sp. G187]|uniref:sensor histidine kinase n=1 Tax=Rhizobium sp. G187 TaxID=3451352 RepID=UPI003EE73CD4